MLNPMMLSFPKSDRNNIVMAIFMKINMIFISDTVKVMMQYLQKELTQQYLHNISGLSACDGDRRCVYVCRSCPDRRTYQVFCPGHTAGDALLQQLLLRGTHSLLGPVSVALTAQRAGTQLSGQHRHCAHITYPLTAAYPFKD